MIRIIIQGSKILSNGFNLLVLLSYVKYAIFIKRFIATYGIICEVSIIAQNDITPINPLREFAIPNIIATFADAMLTLPAIAN